MASAQYHTYRIINGFRALIAVGCIGFIVVDGGPKLYGMLMAHVYATKVATATPQWKIDHGRENSFERVCAFYSKASFIQKWTNLYEYRWCEDYLRRL